VIKFGLLDFSIVFNTEVFTVKLPVVTVNLMTESAAKKAVVAGLISKVVEQAFVYTTLQSVHTAPTAVAEEIMTGKEVDAAKETPTPIKTKTKKSSFMKQPPSGKELKAAAEASSEAGSPMVKLEDATELGQKVFGTSPGAVYRCVAVGPVNVAVKPGSQQVSVRVEGPNLQGLQSKLAQIGFTKGASGKYWSMHLNLGDFDMLRAIGGLLFSLDVGFNKIVSSRKEFM
jgi:hypothetical protein